MSISKNGFSLQHADLILDSLPSRHSSTNVTEEPNLINSSGKSISEESIVLSFKCFEYVTTCLT
jgi:hypothetical protein